MIQVKQNGFGRIIMRKTNFFFNPGKISVILDAGAGSSGKAKVGSYVAENADNWTFCINTFHPQSGHWSKKEDGREFFYQTLNSCAYLDSYEKMYISPASVIDLEAFFEEMEKNNIASHRIGISPVATILQDMDAKYEKGIVHLDGSPKPPDSGTMRNGSTCKGVGAANARKLLRREDTIYAKDVPELKPFICDVPNEVVERLEKGEAGFGEIAQGFQLSLNHSKFAPFTTSRNVMVSQFLSDCFLPPKFGGQVLLNFRTFPIRINSNKYIGEDGRHLTHEEVVSGVPHKVYKGDSGPGYDDQKELTWEELTEISGSPDPIIEMTSVTRLARRPFTFSKQNLEEALRFNDCDLGVWLSLNFADYVDPSMAGRRGTTEVITPKMQQWLEENFGEHLSKLKFIGTGPLTEDTIQL